MDFSGSCSPVAQSPLAQSPFSRLEAHFALLSLPPLCRTGVAATQQPQGLYPFSCTIVVFALILPSTEHLEAGADGHQCGVHLGSRHVRTFFMPAAHEYTRMLSYATDGRPLLMSFANCDVCVVCVCMCVCVCVRLCICLSVSMTMSMCVYAVSVACLSGYVLMCLHLC